MAKSKKAEVETVVEDFEMDALFAELDSLTEEEASDIEEVVTEDIEIDEEDLESIVDVIEAKEEAYTEEAKAEVVAEAEESEPEDDLEAALELLESKSETYDAEEVEEVIAEATEDKKPKAKKAKTVSIAKGLIGSEALKAKLGGTVNDYMIFSVSEAELSEEAQRELAEARLSMIDTLPKKVKEKVVNVFDRVTSGKALSCYTRIAIDLLTDKGSVTSKDIIERYKARPYTPGTSSSQAGQMMKLLPALGIAKREGSSLVLNDESILLPLLCEVWVSAEEAA